MFNRFIKDMRKYLPFSFVSAKSQLKSEVANSYLNWIWWILDPICFMIIYTFIFGYVFNSREPFFQVFIFIGLSMWDFFNRTMTNSVKLIRNNKPIVSKVYIPKYVLLFVKLWVNGFKMMISFGVVLLMMLIFHVPITWHIIFFVPIIIVLAMFTFGCAVHLMHFGVYVEDLANVVTITLRFVFYLTGIFYNIETRIPGWGATLNRYNPLAFLITEMRNCMLYDTAPDFPLLFIWGVISLIICVLGIRRIYREENSYVKVI